MNLLDSLTVLSPNARQTIELYHGDLTDMPPEHAVDVVIVSAYPRVYTPSRTSVMGALHKKGISVDALSLKKAVDLTQAFSSWMSREIPTGIPGIHFNRIKIARSHTDAYLSFYDKLTYAHPYSTRSVHFPQHRETLARNQFVAVFLGRLSDSRCAAVCHGVLTAGDVCQRCQGEVICNLATGQ